MNSTKVNVYEHGLLLFLCQSLVRCKNSPTKVAFLLVMAERSPKKSKAFRRAIKRFDGITSPKELVAVVKQLRKDLL